MVWETLSHLSQVGTRLSVLTQHTRLPLTSEDAEYQGVTRVTQWRPMRELAAVKNLRARKHSHTVICGIWYPEALLASFARCSPIVILAHGSELFPTRAVWRRTLWKWLARRVLSRANLVIANSNYTKDLVGKVAPGANVFSIPLGVNHQTFSPGDPTLARERVGLPKDDLVILSVSRLVAYKGHDVVFRALSELGEPIKDRLVYAIVGDGPDRSAIERSAVRIGVSQMVRWCGFVEDERLPDFYRAADLFVLCTREVPEALGVEGFGLVFLEAQACGTPVVGTSTGGIPDAVRHGDGGWLIEQDDHRALADLLGRLADDPASFAEQGRCARARVERECTWEHYVNRFRAVLDERGIDLG